jgi:phage shock protein PspC (stress-responsive transcriptional regulator)
MLGGVAAGLGEHLAVDPVLVRVGFVLLALVHGLGLLAYLVCWLVIPRRDTVWTSVAPDAGDAAAPAPDTRPPGAEPAAAQLLVGSTMVIAGVLLLAHNLDWFAWPHWLRLSTLWPVLLVALGLGLIAKSRRAASLP